MHIWGHISRIFDIDLWFKLWAQHISTLFIVPSQIHYIMSNFLYSNAASGWIISCDIYLVWCPELTYLLFIYCGNLWRFGIWNVTARGVTSAHPKVFQYLQLHDTSNFLLSKCSRDFFFSWYLIDQILLEICSYVVLQDAVGYGWAQG